MKEIKPELETFARIKVVGVGGGGNNAISRMMEANLKGIDFIAVNADAQDLHHCKVPEKIHIGKNLTRGLGAGMNPDIGRQAAEETRDEIQDVLKSADMVFVTCGLGGGTGTGAAPIIAQAAKEAGALTVAVVTKPFAFEGMQRKKIAEAGLDVLKSKVDTIITIPNDKILQVIDKRTPLLDAFKIVDDVLRQAVQGISDLITIPGIVNVDFADVKAIMQNTGPALMGIGRASGDNRAIDAAKQAINSPLLELSIHGAKGVLFNISGGSDLTMMEVNDAAQIITESADPEAKVIFGAITDTDQDLKKGEVKITVIATGFQQPMSAARERERNIGKLFEEVSVDKAEPETQPEPSSQPKFEPAKEDPFRPKVEIAAPKQEVPTFSRKNLSISIADVFKKDLKDRRKEDQKAPEVKPEENNVESVSESVIGQRADYFSANINNSTEDGRRYGEVPQEKQFSENIFNVSKNERQNERQGEVVQSRPFSSKISNISYRDEYDIPAFLRKKMDKSQKD